MGPRPAASPARCRTGRDDTVSHAWLVNPVEQTLEILRLSPQGWTIAQVLTGRAPVRAEPFDAVELDLGAQWTLSSEGPADDEP